MTTNERNNKTKKTMIGEQYKTIKNMGKEKKEMPEAEDWEEWVDKTVRQIWKNVEVIEPYKKQ